MVKHTKLSDEDDICDCIMNEVACNEERRLIRTLFLIGPLLIISSWIIIVALHLSLMEFLKNDGLQVLEAMRAEGSYFSQQSFILLQLFWAQMQEDLFVLLLIGVTVIGVIIAKSKLLSFPYRARQIKKYKSETS